MVSEKAVLSPNVSIEHFSMSFQAISRQFGGEVQCKKSAWPDLTF